MRDTKLLESYLKKEKEKNQSKLLQKNLRRVVNIGANGTQDYVIKKGVNVGKVANKNGLG